MTLAHARRPLRILLVATYSQALSAFVAPLARYLEGHGHDVTMAASSEPLIGPATFPQLNADGFRTRVIPFTNRMRPDRDLVSMWRLYHLIRREQFDIVHTFTAKAGFLGRIAGRAARAPAVVHTAFSFPHIDTPQKSWLYFPMERLATRLSDHVFCISQLGFRQAQSLGAAPRAGVSNPGIGLNLARFERLCPREDARAGLGLPSGVPLVGVAARLVQHKGVDVFLAACRGVADPRHDARFIVVGSGPEGHALRNQCERLGLSDRVRFLERLGDDQMVAFFRALDVFMLPTRREGFGMVFAEAMSQETPAIGPRIAPVDEIVVDGETGLLIDDERPESYAAATLSLLADANLRARFGAAARRRVWQCFDERRSFARVEDTYWSVLGTRS